MILNGKVYVFDKKTSDENAKFIDLLTTAEDKLSQALECITYSSFPKLNKGTVDKLNKIIEDISKITCDISENNKLLLKPIVVKEKENIIVYQPKTLEQAKKLFNKFKSMNLDLLDEERFLLLYEKGKGEIGFCVRHNTFQVCDIKSNDLFNVILAEI